MTRETAHTAHEKIAVLAPVAMQDDEPMLRTLLDARAQEHGVTLPENATITTRVLTDVLDPEIRMLHVEAEF